MVIKKQEEETSDEFNSDLVKESLKIHKKDLRVLERVPTGIANFDELIGGGFKKNSINLIAGGSGSGKSIFGIQFLIEGIKKGETCLFITFEEERKEFFSNMKELGFDLEDLERKDKLFFIEYTPEKVRTMLEEGGGIIENIILKKKIKRVVIDSLTSFSLLFENDFERRDAFFSLFDMLKKWECTTILTYGGYDIISGKIARNNLGFGSDSIIVLYFLRNKGDRERYLEIFKMRGTNHSKKISTFFIGKNGIILDKKAFSGIIKI